MRAWIFSSLILDTELFQQIVTPFVQSNKVPSDESEACPFLLPFKGELLQDMYGYKPTRSKFPPIDNKIPSFLDLSTVDPKERPLNRHGSTASCSISHSSFFQEAKGLLSMIHSSNRNTSMIRQEPYQAGERQMVSPVPQDQKEVRVAWLHFSQIGYDFKRTVTVDANESISLQHSLRDVMKKELKGTVLLRKESDNKELSIKLDNGSGSCSSISKTQFHITILKLTEYPGAGPLLNQTCELNLTIHEVETSTGDYEEADI